MKRITPTATAEDIECAMLVDGVVWRVVVSDEYTGCEINFFTTTIAFNSMASFGGLEEAAEKIREINAENERASVQP